MTAVLPDIAIQLRCPECRAHLVPGDAAVVCENSHAFPVHDGYLDFSGRPLDADTARTMASFGYEWNTFDRINPEDEKYWNWYFADVPLAELAGVRALDAGCGKGRYTRFTAAHVGSMVALDGSSAVEAAARNLADLPDVVVVKSDLRDPPFAPESFGFVSCLGVIHHLPDPEEGFRGLAGLVAPGGLFLVYLYSRPESPGVRGLGLEGARLLRKLTTRLPHRVLRAMCVPLAALLWLGFVAPGTVGSQLGVERLASLPMQTYRRRPLRSLWLDTFDRLSAPLENRYVRSEVEPWFTSAGLTVEAVRDDAGLFILGRKAPAPSSGAPPASGAADLRSARPG